MACALLTGCPSEDPDPLPPLEDAGEPDAGAAADAGAVVTDSGVVDAGLTPFEIISRSPTPGETGVALDGGVVVQFSVPLDVATLTTSGFTVSSSLTGPIPGAVTYDEPSHAAQFMPNGFLPADEWLTATVSVDVRSTNGQVLSRNEVWTFRTQPLVKTDVTPPTVTAHSPDAGESAVPVTTNLTVSFSEPVQPSSVTPLAFSLVRLQPLPIVNVAGTVIYDEASRTATFTPSAALTGASRYELMVTAPVKDLAGNVMAAPHVFSFDTEVDTEGPLVVETAPADLSSNVSPMTTAFAVRFSEEVDPRSLYDGGLQFTSYVPVDAGEPDAGFDAGIPSSLAGVITYEPRTRTAAFVPSRPLDRGAIITGTVSQDVRDLSGNAAAAPYTFSFTTEEAPAGPSVLSVVPPPDARIVPRSARVTVTFERDVDASTVTAANLRITGHPATVTYDAATRTATLTPPVFFPPAAEMTVTVANVTDVNGVAMDRPFSWSFRTLGDPVKLSVDALPDVRGLSAVQSGSDVMAAWFSASGSTTRARWALRKNGAWTGGVFVQTSTIDPPKLYALGSRFGAAHGFEVINPKFSVFDNGAWTQTTGYLNGAIGVLGTTAVNVVANGTVDAYRLVAGTTDWVGPVPLANQGDSVQVVASATKLGVAWREPTAQNGCRLVFRAYDGTNWTFASTISTVTSACSNVPLRLATNGTTFAASYVSLGDAMVAVYDVVADSWSSGAIGSGAAGPVELAAAGTEFGALYRKTSSVFFGTTDGTTWRPDRLNLLFAPDSVVRFMGGRAGYLVLGHESGELAARTVSPLMSVTTATVRAQTTQAQLPVLLSAVETNAGFKVTYEYADDVYVRAFENGAWSGERRLNSNGGGTVATFVEGSSTTLIHSDAGEVRAREHTGGAALTDGELLPIGPMRGSATSPSSALRSDGSALVTWAQYDRGVWRCFLRYFNGVSWSPPSRIQYSVLDGERCVAGTNGRTFVVAWVSANGNNAVNAARWTPGGGLEAPAVFGFSPASDLRASSDGEQIGLLWAASPTATPGAGAVISRFTADGVSWSSQTTVLPSTSTAIYEPMDFAAGAGGFVFSTNAFGTTSYPAVAIGGPTQNTSSARSKVASGARRAVLNPIGPGTLYLEEANAFRALSLTGSSGVEGALACFGDELRVVAGGKTFLTSGVSVAETGTVERWTTGEVSMKCDLRGCALFGRQDPNFTELRALYTNGSSFKLMGLVAPNATSPVLLHVGGRYGLSYLVRDNTREADEAFFVFE